MPEKDNQSYNAYTYGKGKMSKTIIKRVKTINLDEEKRT